MGDAAQVSAMDRAEFLATMPPDSSAEISNLCFQQGNSMGYRWVSHTPDVELHCEQCGGPRFFKCDDGTIYVEGDKWKFDFLHYSCRNCRKGNKIYAVAVRQKPNSTSGLALKFGESPAFGPHTPARVISLIGPDRELFLKGRRAENRGLGIGAFSYYRQVVENQKVASLNKSLR